MRIRKIAAMAFLVVLVGVAAYLLIKQHVTSEEARIRKLIDDIEQAFEKKKLKACLAVVADDYSDNVMHNSKADLEDNLRALFAFGSDLRVRLEDPAIRVDGDHATVALTITGSATVTTEGDIRFEEETHFTRFELLLRKEHGRWRVYRAVGIDERRD